MPGSIRSAALALAAFLACLTLAAAPASADPEEVRITGVFHTADCAGDPCEPGRDPALKAGTVVAGSIEVHVQARADLGLEWVRLEAQYPGNPRFFCLEHWTANRALSFESQRLWRTDTWTDPRRECTPETCSNCLENSPHKHGAPTRNRPHLMRVVARESVSGEEAASATFEVVLANAPRSPAWVAEPQTQGDDDPAVLLQWKPNPEPDVSEYHFVRVGPDGDEAEFAVSARDPEAHGCSRVGAIAYRCLDDGFESSGEYRYAVFALRPAVNGVRCSLRPGRCAESDPSEVRTASVTVPDSPSGSGGDGSGSGTRTDRGTRAGGRGGARPTAPVEVDASQDRTEQLTAAGDSDQAGAPPALKVVAVLLLLLVAPGYVFSLAKRRRAHG